jgi:hypothetical protein
MSPINKSEAPKVNRGVELLLKNRREKQVSEPSHNGFEISKVISLLKREVRIQFSFSIVKKD